METKEDVKVTRSIEGQGINRVKGESRRIKAGLRGQKMIRALSKGSRRIKEGQGRVKVSKDDHRIVKRVKGKARWVKAGSRGQKIIRA